MDKSLKAALRELLRCEAKGATVLPRRVLRALAPWARDELKKLNRRAEKKKAKKKEKESLKEFTELRRWGTCSWFLEKGCDWPTARKLAAKALGKNVGGEGTIKRGYEDFKKRHHLPRGRSSPLIAAKEEDAFLFIPEESVLTEVLAEHEKSTNPD